MSKNHSDAALSVKEKVTPQKPKDPPADTRSPHTTAATSRPHQAEKAKLPPDRNQLQDQLTDYIIQKNLQHQSSEAYKAENGRKDSLVQCYTNHTPFVILPRAHSHGETPDARHDRLIAAERGFRVQIQESQTELSPAKFFAVKNSGSHWSLQIKIGDTQTDLTISGSDYACAIFTILAILANHENFANTSHHTKFQETLRKSEYASIQSEFAHTKAFAPVTDEGEYGISARAFLAEVLRETNYLGDSKTPKPDPQQGSPSWCYNQITANGEFVDTDIIASVLGHFSIPCFEVGEIEAATELLKHRPDLSDRILNNLLAQGTHDEQMRRTSEIVKLYEFCKSSGYDDTRMAEIAAAIGIEKGITLRDLASNAIETLCATLSALTDARYTDEGKS
jgi:hypothetical protein